MVTGYPFKNKTSYYTRYLEIFHIKCLLKVDALLEVESKLDGPDDWYITVRYQLLGPFNLIHDRSLSVIWTVQFDIWPSVDSYLGSPFWHMTVRFQLFGPFNLIYDRPSRVIRQSILTYGRPLSVIWSVKIDTWPPSNSYLDRLINDRPISIFWVVKFHSQRTLASIHDRLL